MTGRSGSDVMWLGAAGREAMVCCSRGGIDSTLVLWATHVSKAGGPNRAALVSWGGCRWHTHSAQSDPAAVGSGAGGRAAGQPDTPARFRERCLGSWGALLTPGTRQKHGNTAVGPLAQNPFSGTCAPQMSHHPTGCLSVESPSQTSLPSSSPPSASRPRACHERGS
jgi:hypothetical protein